jgi:hypothetical protein
MKHESSSSEHDAASAVLNGIAKDSSIVENLARFISYNATALKSLCMDADAPGNKIQATRMNSCVVQSQEDLRKLAANFIAVLLSLSEGFEQDKPKPPSPTAAPTTTTTSITTTTITAKGTTTTTTTTTTNITNGTTTTTTTTEQSEFTENP